MSFFEELKVLAGTDNYYENEPMKEHTTFRTGGPSDCFVTPDSILKLCEITDFCRNSGVKHMIIGNGSNVLFPDDGYRGVVIGIGNKLSEITRDGDEIHAMSGAMLSAVSAKAAGAGLTGLEFASGIPGTVGGAVVMNAGAYGGEIKDVIAGVLVYDTEGNIIRLSHDELELGYRTSVIQKKDYIVLKAFFKLTCGNEEEIFARMKELNAKRRDKQPLNYASAGSTFKRPEGYYAAALIDECGLKGYACGDAMVSEKHAGFVVNVGNATSQDILNVIEHVRETVFEMKGVRLETEVRVID